jgi:hypothetical protein
MEEKEGVKAERYGSRIEVYPSTLQPIQLHKDCKKEQLLFFTPINFIQYESTTIKREGSLEAEV